MKMSRWENVACSHNQGSFIKIDLIAVWRLGKRENRLKAERLLLCPEFEVVGPKLESWPWRKEKRKKE